MKMKKKKKEWNGNERVPNSDLTSKWYKLAVNHNYIVNMTQYY